MVFGRRALAWKMSTLRGRKTFHSHVGWSLSHYRRAAPPVPVDTGEREEGYCMQLSGDVSAFTVGNDLPTNAQTLLSCQCTIHAF